MTIRFSTKLVIWLRRKDICKIGENTKRGIDLLYFLFSYERPPKPEVLDPKLKGVELVEYFTYGVACSEVEIDVLKGETQVRMKREDIKIYIIRLVLANCHLLN